MSTLAEKYRDIQFCEFDGKEFCGALYLADNEIERNARVLEVWWVASEADAKDPRNLFDTNVITPLPEPLQRAPNPGVKHIPNPVTVVISEGNHYFYPLSKTNANALKASMNQA